MPDISFDPVTDPAALGCRWRALEVQADGGFFRSWTYLGALLPHFSAPHLLAVRQDRQDLALGLFNWTRRGLSTKRGLFLHETGDPLWDRLYVEHNGLLLHPDGRPHLAEALTAASTHGPVALSGIDALHAEAAAQAGTLQTRKIHFAPALDLAALAAAGKPYLDTLSANARSQIRRAMRLYGPDLTLQPAATLGDAQTDFSRMIALHQASWTARGEPGAFASPAIIALHTTLIATGFPRGEIALLRIQAGGQEIGILYQFQHGGKMLAYQSGFAPTEDARLKPGLVGHSLAIAHAQHTGMTTYDFLAGAQRYKTTLAPQGGETLHWITLHRRGSVKARLHAVRRWLGK
jgi:CelD/BcsL family acetyltransferase involved in cellulose biosynthesis